MLCPQKLIKTSVVSKLQDLTCLTCCQAVELDELTPVDELVKHSSSAVDIRTVLMQVR